MATTIILGSNSNRIRLLLGVTGLTHASSGLIISTIADNEASATVYAAGSSNIESITTLGTYAAPTGGKCRFSEVDATNHPGLYEIQLADARFSVANASRLAISISGATGLPATGVHYEVDLKADADVKTWRGTQPNTLQSGRVDTYVGANNDKTGYSLASGAITSSTFANDSITAAALAADAGTEIASAVASSGGLSTSQAAQLSGVYTRVHGIPVVLSSTATNVFSGNPLTIYHGSEHSSYTPLGPVTFNVSDSYSVSGWTGTLKIFEKYGSATDAVISVAGSWADTGLTTQRIEFTLQETDTDNLDVSLEYAYQVELVCGTGHPYASPKGSVIFGSIHS